MEEGCYIQLNYGAVTQINYIKQIYQDTKLIVQIFRFEYF